MSDENVSGQATDTGGANDNTGGAGNEPTWRDNLAEEYRGATVLQDFKDVNGLAKAYIDTKQMVGNTLRVPSDEAGNEDWDKFYNTLNERTNNRVMPRPDPENPEAVKAIYNALGRPEEAKEYELPKHEGLDLPEERQALLREAAYEANLTKTQFNKVLDKVLAADAAAVADQQHALQEGMKALNQEWGVTFDNKVRAAEQVKNQFFKFIDVPVSQLGADTVRAFAQLAEQFGGEGKGLIDGHQQESGKLTPDEAKLQIAEMMNNKNHPYWNKADPGNEAARRKMRELHKLADPGPADGVGGGGFSVGGLGG